MTSVLTLNEQSGNTISTLLTSFNPNHGLCVDSCSLRGSSEGKVKKSTLGRETDGEEEEEERNSNR